MKESLEEIKGLIDSCSDEEKDSLRSYLQSRKPHELEIEWKIDADTILSAIHRSNDITKRGVRGIIAEAVFEKSVLPGLGVDGWNAESIDGDRSYDVLLVRDGASVRIQIKLQRLEKGVPLFYRPKQYQKGSLFVVEVQKTRSGKKKKVAVGDQAHGVKIETAESISTRPYSFSDFDILAVNMHPSSGEWRDFRYTIASWLLPRKHNDSLIEIMQPVAAIPNNVWTSDIGECLDWWRSGDKRRVLPFSLDRLVKAKRSKKLKL